MTDFANPKTCRKHKAEKRFKFQIRNRRKENLHFFPGRDKGKIGIKLPHRKLSGIPGFMENIYGKEAQLGDTGVYGAVRKRTILLKPADKIPEFGPGDILRLFEENVLQVIQIRADISRIRYYSVVSKATKGDHLPVNF
jgi:hypothetical protein